MSVAVAAAAAAGNRNYTDRRMGRKRNAVEYLSCWSSHWAMNLPVDQRDLVVGGFRGGRDMKLR